MTSSEYKRVQDLPNKTWVCSACITISTHNDLPFHEIGNITLEDLFMNEPAVMDARTKYNSNFLIAHLNINSFQKKFEDEGNYTKAENSNDVHW